MKFFLLFCFPMLLLASVEDLWKFDLRTTKEHNYDDAKISWIHAELYDTINHRPSVYVKYMNSNTTFTLIK